MPLASTLVFVEADNSLNSLACSTGETACCACTHWSPAEMRTMKMPSVGRTLTYFDAVAGSMPPHRRLRSRAWFSLPSSARDETRALSLWLPPCLASSRLSPSSCSNRLSTCASAICTRDALARVGRKAPPNPDLVFLAIDSASVGLEEKADLEELYGFKSADSDEAHALKLMSKRWPWSREVYGLVLERLVKAGAKVVLFDLTFPTPSEGDAPFRIALDRYKDRVVIGSNFVSTTSHGFSTAHTSPPETLVPQTVPMDDRVAFVNF